MKCPRFSLLTEQWHSHSIRDDRGWARAVWDLEGDVTGRPESVAWVSDSPHASLKAWHCQRGKNTILSFSAIRTHSPCQTCHMSPSQVVLLAYRVWQGYSHTASNQTPSPAEKKSICHPRTVTGCQTEGIDPPQALNSDAAPVGGGSRGQRSLWEGQH